MTFNVFIHGYFLYCTVMHLHIAECNTILYLFNGKTYKNAGRVIEYFISLNDKFALVWQTEINMSA